MHRDPLIAHHTSGVRPSIGGQDPAAVVYEIATLIDQFEPIGLDEMEEVKLLNRVDTKFLLCDWQLLWILTTLRHGYRVLSAGGHRLNRYKTVYFDTPDLLLYRQHHNDVANRYKVRSRAYLDTGVAFLEVKQKTNKGRTVKQRQPVPALLNGLDGPARAFVDAHTDLDSAQLLPDIWNRFSRITLVSKSRPERLTLDLSFTYGWADVEGGLPGLAIAEVKQPKFSVHSDFVTLLHRQGIRRTGFSKYCAGVSDLYPGVKYNRFKRRGLLIERLYRLRGRL